MGAVNRDLDLYLLTSALCPFEGEEGSKGAGRAGALALRVCQHSMVLSGMKRALLGGAKGWNWRLIFAIMG